MRLQEQSIFLCAIIGFILCCLSCNPPDPEKQLIGKWIGYYKYNISAQPFPAIIKFNENGTAIQFDPQSGEVEVQWDWIQDVIKVDTVDYLVSKITEDFLEVKVDESKYVFKKIKEKPQIIPVPEQLSLIRENFWVCRNEYIYDNDFGVIELSNFEDDHRSFLKSYYVEAELIFEQQERDRTTISEFDGQLFLSESDLYEGYDTTFINLMPIEFEDENNFLVWEYKQRKAFKKRFCKSTGFEVADSSFYKCKKTYIRTYFQNNLGYEGDKPTIEDHFTEIFQKQYLETDDGYVTVLFIVNCEGKMGDFELQLCDKNFEKTDFSLNLIKDILQKTRTLNEWKIGVDPKDKSKKLDSRNHLLFKFNKGKLTALLP